jgi:hypothetical protein
MYRYREHGEVYRRNKALYGLRISPLLWQRTLICALIDDIVLVDRKRDESGK